MAQQKEVGWHRLGYNVNASQLGLTITNCFCQLEGIFSVPLKCQGAHVYNRLTLMKLVYLLAVAKTMIAPPSPLCCPHIFTSISTTISLST